ncbi:unnamed protein product [Caenorhabditis angaria]|uniref:Peptidase S1 domain-containing protein n=1 Tax=Caenorhabditis angaria TaxID=860376 RepID=A0A9P1N666_9PELO|nr:unnamed protein product [Caenorhabditis angaria]
MHIIIFIFLFFIILSNGQLSSFNPVWIGPKFRETSMQSISESIQLSEDCGIQKESKHKRFPWAVSFTVDGVNRLGGSIISPYHILTAAHGFITAIGVGGNLCMNLPANRSMYRDIEDLQKTRKIAYGGECIRGFTENLPNNENCSKPDVVFNTIRSVLIDGDFVAGRCIDGHDWAIVEVENRIKFNENVAPICLPRKKMYHSKTLSVPGWGRRYIFNESGPMIHEIPMRIDPDCPRARPWSDNLPIDASDYICATSLDTRDYFAPRTCHGDSGGGLEYRDDFEKTHLIAMTSFGTKGCPANMLARFTRVDRYTQLICQFTGVCYSV